MIEVKINPELRKVKEKAYGLEFKQIIFIVSAMVLIFLMLMFLPDYLGPFKGIIASVCALPLIIISLKDFYGMRGLELFNGIIKGLLTSRALPYDSDAFKEVK